jgi:hypothetical protein
MNKIIGPILLLSGIVLIVIFEPMLFNYKSKCISSTKEPLLIENFSMCSEYRKICYFGIGIGVILIIFGIIFVWNWVHFFIQKSVYRGEKDVLEKNSIQNLSDYPRC